jgi:hypothetical protein
MVRTSFEGLKVRIKIVTLFEVGFNNSEKSGT